MSWHSPPLRTLVGESPTSRGKVSLFSRNFWMGNMKRLGHKGGRWQRVAVMFNYKCFVAARAALHTGWDGKILSWRNGSPGTSPCRDDLAEASLVNKSCSPEAELPNGVRMTASRSRRVEIWRIQFLVTPKPYGRRWGSTTQTRRNKLAS